MRIRPSTEEAAELVRLGHNWASEIRSIPNPPAAHGGKRTATEADLDDLDADFAMDPQATFKKVKQHMQDSGSICQNLKERLKVEKEKREAAELLAEDAESRFRILKRQNDDLLGTIKDLRAQLATRDNATCKGDTKVEQMEKEYDAADTQPHIKVKQEQEE